jgi:hypothetical protein
LSDRLIRRYLAANRLRERAEWQWARVRGLRDAWINGLWLGMFDRDALARLDELHYETLVERGGGNPYAYSDEQWNRSGLSAWEAAVVDEHLPPGGRVVVTGAGGGREVLALRERGFDAVGYEPHPSLVAAGRAILERCGHPDRLHRSARDLFPEAEGRCDAVVVGWGSYMLMPGRARRVAFLEAARERLVEGGPVLLSFFVRSPEDRSFQRLAATANRIRRLRGREPADVGDALRPNYAHFFTQAELEEELAEAGFEAVAFEARPYGHAVARRL